MGNKMFCFQCEQTAGCTGCMGNAGVCGKTADVAQLQDELTGALIGLARATDNAPDVNDGTWRLMIEGLFTTVTNVSFNEKTLRELIDRVHAEKARLVPDCSDCAAPCGRAADYDMARLWNAQEDIRSLKSLILFGVRGMAAYAHHALVLGYTDDAVNDFFAKALFAVGEDWGMEELLPIVMEVGEKNLKCMALLDQANTESYGTPTPVTVPLTVEKGPFIVISGHDLHDLKLLLEQQLEAEGFDIPLLLVDLRVQRRDLLREAHVSVRHRLGGQCDDLFTARAHFDQLSVQQRKLLIKPASHHPNLPVI